MKFPIGYDDFGKVLEKDLTFVDKTLLIKSMLDDWQTEVSVILRPRRFGKTFNLSMLRYFFADEVYGRKTKGMFDNLKIAQLGDTYMQHQGKYPVVAVTFKDIKAAGFASARLHFSKVFNSLYQENITLLNSDKLTEFDKQYFTKIIKEEGTDTDLQSALQNLMRFLYQHHGIKPYLLIDEYDTPILASYISGYYPEMINLMCGLFGTALKGNPYLERAMITGILRVAKESLFSGVNNLKVFSMLSSYYSDYFGFTETEVEHVLNLAGLSEKAGEIRAWYNGYQIGGTVIYNPWSIANLLYEKGALRPYWINTSDNQLIKDLLRKAPLQFKKQFEVLLSEGSVEKLITENMVFLELESNPSAVWNLLLTSGYLTPVSSRETEQGTFAMLKIPNTEIRTLYREIIETWLSDGYGREWYSETLEKTAERALAQINANQYAAECSQRGIGRVLKIGIGFENKTFELVSVESEN